MSIGAPSGLKAPALTTSGKQDGTGNGSGGLFGGGGDQQQDPNSSFFNRQYYPELGLEDVPFVPPTAAPEELDDRLKPLRNALAISLYQSIATAGRS